MNWIEEQYPIGVIVRLPHPETGELSEMVVVNHYIGTDRAITGIIAQFDGGTLWVSASFLAEDGGDRSNAITLQEATDIFPLAYSTLAQAAREGRIQARRSGATWITTRRDIQAAIEAGHLRPR